MEKESSEIVKLTERISKDPKSKLFVPLAEEYKKIGDVEMAVYVLTEGLKNNPSYVTARAILGRLLLDQGDLAGAHKELQEVVKVIPDNLLAQRKIGDICVLQDRSSDALKHYKIVLALSPSDAEVVSLISDIEAGNDVRSRLQQPKGQPIAAATPAAKPQVKQPVKQEVKPEPQIAAPAPPREKPAPVVTPETVTPPTPLTAKAEAVEALPAAAIVAPAAAEKAEEPEEIFMVEPLEKEKQEPVARVPASEVPAEPEASSAPIDSVREPEEGFSAHAEPESFREPDVFEAPLSQPEKTIRADFAEAMKETETPSPKQERVEESDDFTTDTLAELYIAQGFYEKAIDIYERMLVDNPNSRGLKDKLDKVREMAAASAIAEEKPAADLFAEPQVYSAQEELADAGGKPKFVGEPTKDSPAPKEDAWQEPDKEAEPEVLVHAPEPKAAQPKPMYTDFEPREYAPPTEEAELVEASVAPVVEKAERPRAATKSSTAIRKDTIERLESWLKNIKKES
jgi:tetratricopeptide (TPR) repeat protein